jgi:hypothetical protein
MAFAYAQLGQQEGRAIAYAATAARLSPMSVYLGIVHADANFQAGRDAAALEALVAAPFPELLKSEFREQFDHGGMAAVWTTLLDVQAQSSGTECGELGLFAASVSVTVLDDNDRAIRCLQRGFDERSLSDAAYLKVGRRWDPLRGDARFQAILEGMGLAH